MLILFISVSLNVANEIAVSAASIQAEQLYTVAERVMDKILLTTGIPADWGNNVTVTPGDISDFGLALNGTRTPYELDPDKVMRLANLSTLPNPLFMNASRIAELLGISDKYGFKLEMHPLLRQEILPIDFYDLPGKNLSIPVVFNVIVRNWYDFGIPGASVTGIYVLVKISPGAAGKQPTIQEKTFWAKTNVTDVKGICVLNFKNEVSNHISNQAGRQRWYIYFLILHTNWYGFVSVSGYTKSSLEGAPVEGYIIGDAVILNSTVERLRGAVITKDEIIQVIPEYESLLAFSEIEWCRQQPNDPEWCKKAGNVLPSSRDYLIGRIKSLEKISSHVFVFGKWRGQPIAIVINRIPDLTITFGHQKAQPANSVVLTRLAQLYNYPYIIRLTIWRKTEG